MTARRAMVLASRSILALCALGTLACGPGVIRARPTERAEGPRAESRETPEQVRVRRLLVSYAGAEGASRETSRSREDARERAGMLAGMVRNGDLSFRELITQYGDVPPDVDDRTTLRIVRPGQSTLSEVEAEAALGLDEGQVSRPVETTAGYVIILREPDPTEEEEGPSRIGARHILIQYEGSARAAPGVTRTRAEALALARQLAVTAAEEGADWVALHAEHSDEPDSPEGGDLGVFGHGQMVRSFDRAAFRLEVDEVSDPVESEFGFHIIQRTE